MTNFISCFSYQVISTVDVRNLRFTVSSCAISTTTRNYFFQQQREKTSWLITAFIPYVRWNAVPVSVYSLWALTIFCKITTRTTKQKSHKSQKEASIRLLSGWTYRATIMFWMNATSRKFLAIKNKRIWTRFMSFRHRMVLATLTLNECNFKSYHSGSRIVTFKVAPILS